MFIGIEKTPKVRENSLFIAPKAVSFIFMMMAYRGFFNFYPLNILKLTDVFKMTKMVTFGLLALGAGLDGNLKSYGGFFQSLFASLWELQDENEHEER